MSTPDVEADVTAQSITQWLQAVKAGDSFSEYQLWNRFFPKMIRIADRKLSDCRLRLGGSEDVASIAFSQFLRCVKIGRFKKMENRSDLWQVLVMLTVRRALDHIDVEMAERRGNRKLCDPGGLPDDRITMDHFADSVPTPEYLCQLAEELELRFDQLGNNRLRRVARMKLEGCFNHEIAEHEQVSVRSIERDVSAIREQWSDEINGIG